MTDKQPEALRLAEHDERLSGIMRMEPTYAPELRRLHELNAELVETLRPIAEQGEISAKIIANAKAAIAKATGEQQ